MSAQVLQIQSTNLEGRIRSKAVVPQAGAAVFGPWDLKFLWSLVVGNWSFVPRGLALFLGVFSLLNLLGDYCSAHFDANLWWIDLRSIRSILVKPFILISSCCLIAFAVRPPRSSWRRWLTGSCAALLGIVALMNSGSFYYALALGTVRAGLPIPLSLAVAGGLAWIVAAAMKPTPPQKGVWQLWLVAGVCLACAVAFPIAQMFCFGKTDYRRPADVVVVLGARVYASGKPSDALSDRVRTGCELYKQGLAGKVLFSGGPGDGAVHETEAMKKLAIQFGVNPEDILLDAQGVNTQSTVKNTEAIFAALHASRVLVVSHSYHLPRVKLAYQRAGWDVYTVPAKETYLLRQMPYFMAREIAALWVYYLRPLAGPPRG